MKKFGVQFGLNAQRLSQQWDGINPELELIRQKHRQLLEEKYNSKKILINSLLLSLAWLVTFVFYTITFMLL